MALLTLARLAGGNEAFERAGYCRRRGWFIIVRLTAGRGVDDFGPVLHDALERAHAALAEVEAARQRLDAHPQVLHLDAGTGCLKHDVVQDLVVEGIPLGPRAIELLVLDAAPRLALQQVDIELRLDVQDLVERVRVEEQLQQRPEQLAGEAHEPTMRRKQRLIVEFVGRFDLGRVDKQRADRRPALAELLQQIGAQVLGLQEFFEPHAGQLANLIFGVVGAALLENAGADLRHDLLDVDRLGTNGELAHRLLNLRTRISPAGGVSGWQTRALPRCKCRECRVIV